MPRESQTKVIGRDRPPRVHISYDVNVDGAIENRELPFVVGILADLSGNKPTRELAKLKDRKLVEIHPDNFDEVMRAQGVGLEIKVDNTLEGNDTTFPVKLKFESMDDFHPDRVVQQVEPLRALLETRQQLEALLNKADNDDALRDKLEEILKKTEAIAAQAKPSGRE